MSVKYSKPWVVAFFILGLVLSGMGFYLFQATGDFQVGIITGPMLLLFGILASVNPFYVFKDGVLQARNLLGMTLFRHPLEKLTVEPGAKPDERRLFVIKNAEKGKKKRIMSTHTLFFDKKDVRQMIDAVQGQQAF